MHRRTAAALLLTTAILASFAPPAAAATTNQTTGTRAEICPGILCTPFWKTDPLRKPKMP